MDPKNKEFEKLFREFYEPIYRFVYYTSNGSSETEDLVSQSFFEAFKSYEKCNGNFKPWIYKIASNNVKDFFKSYRNKNVIANDENIMQTKTDLSFENEIEKKETYDFILNKINELPLNQKEAMLLRYVDELEYPEISNILDKNEGAIRTLISKALKTLRLNIEDERVKKNIKFIFIPPLIHEHLDNVNQSLFSKLNLTQTAMQPIIGTKILVIGSVILTTIGGIIGGIVVFNQPKENMLTTKEVVSSSPSSKTSPTEKSTVAVTTTVITKEGSQYYDNLYDFNINLPAGYKFEVRSNSGPCTAYVQYIRNANCLGSDPVSYRVIDIFSNDAKYKITVQPNFIGRGGSCNGAETKYDVSFFNKVYKENICKRTSDNEFYTTAGGTLGYALSSKAKYTEVVFDMNAKDENMLKEFISIIGRIN